MKYALMIQVTAEALDALSESERRAFDDAHRSLYADTQASGELLSTHQLGDIAHTTTVRSVGGQPTVTDGPYAEMKEFLGGYYLFDVDSKDRAVELAKRLPEARIDGCAIEVRPVMFSAGADL
jgi:hypothetical protein